MQIGEKSLVAFMNMQSHIHSHNSLKYLWQSVLKLQDHSINATINVTKNPNHYRTDLSYSQEFILDVI